VNERSEQVTAGELVLVASALAIIIAAELILLRGSVLFTQPLWLDEHHTLLLAGRQTLGDSMRSLAAGSDFNPPGLYLLYRLAGTILGGLAEVNMRAVSLTSVWLACVGTFALLRTRFDRVGSFLGALAVWAHPLVVAEAFDARFYGPWLFYAVLFALTVEGLPRARSLFGQAIAPALASVLLCTIHYFGVVSWAAIIVAALFTLPEGVGHRVRLLAPTILGPVALACCLPFYLGQRQALTIPTWISPPTLRSLVFLLAFVFVSPTVVASLICSRVSQDVARIRGLAIPSRSVKPLVGGPALLLSLASVPFALIAFSLMVQPVSIARYWITGVLATAVIVAWVASHVGSSYVAFLYLVTGVAGIVTLHVNVNGAVERTGDFQSNLRNIERYSSATDLIVAHRRHSLYPLLRAAPGLADRAVVLDAVGLDMDARKSQVELDVARVHLRLYGFPHIIDAATLDTRQSFLVLESPDEGDTLRSGAFPGFDVDSLAPRLRRYVRRANRPVAAH